MQTTEILPVAIPLAPAAPRGVAPDLLVKQVANTAPFIFDGSLIRVSSNDYRYLDLLRAQASVSGDSFLPLNPAQYFELCLATHWATVGTFVPTDVDNAIRFKLWAPGLPTEHLDTMIETVLRARHWDATPVNTRWILSPKSKRLMAGHLGEWFSVAAAAYGASRRRAPARTTQLIDEIFAEVRRHSELVEEFLDAKEYLGLLKTSVLVAHNLGDLDRVIDQWNLAQDDPLRLAVYRLGHEESGKLKPLMLAGALNKQYMAAENHRHFSLRVPRALRKSADFLIPIGPFFDDWGKAIGKHPLLKFEEIGKVIEALIAGWEKLPSTVGYARALTGILDTFPGGMKTVSDYLPARVFKTLKAGPLRVLCEIPRTRFESQWSKFAQLQPSLRGGQ